jgi:DNA polymerase bacteriophage-type
MPLLQRDYETRSELGLPEVGAHKYAVHPSTDVWCYAYAVDDGPIQLWVPGDPVPLEVIEAAQNPDWLVSAWNDVFERSIERHIMGPRYGWPLVPIERHRCSMAAALALALPAALEKAAVALGLEERKDTAGRRLMLQMSRPRKPLKGEDPKGIYWMDDPASRARLGEYCRQDVATERAAHMRTGFLTAALQAEWILDATINDRGFHTDLALAKAARELVRVEQKRIKVDVAALTGNVITSIGQVGRIKAFLKDRGHDVQGVGKRSVSAVLACDPSDEVRQLLELRQVGGSASVHKLDSLFACADADQRVRGTLKFHGSSTGRWSGSRFQPQNLKKPVIAAKDIDTAVDAVIAGDTERLRELGDTLSVIGDITRSIVCAAPGHVLIGADFSAIESRLLAWIAGEKWKLENYRDFDRTGDPALEPYCVTASRLLGRVVTPDDEVGRGTGKIADLALGYGGGLGAWRRFDPDSAETDVAVQGHVNKWREQHRAIVAFWHTLENVIKHSVRTGARVEFGNLAAEITDGTLFITLPSGRKLAYPGAHFGPGKFDSMQIYFRDNARGGWKEMRGWHGTWAENLVQAMSRDLLVGAMTRLEAAGYPIVLTVHDEVICEVPEGFGSVDEMRRLVLELPPWAEGLPIAAKVWTRSRYIKTAELPPPQQTGVVAMEFSSKRDDAWLAKANDAAIAGARKSALGPLMNTPVGRLTDLEWGTIVSAAIFNWIEARVQQAVAEGLDQEATVRLTGFSPDPCDVAVVTSILSLLADNAGIDWSLPLSSWSKDQMINFLMMVWRLMRDAEGARDNGPGGILRKSLSPLEAAPSF